MRGLKYHKAGSRRNLREVAPFTGAWIEIEKMKKALGVDTVAPFTGAWIEIEKMKKALGVDTVAPFTGAWIEIAPSTLCNSIMR